METKNKIILAVIALVIAFGAGRWSVPEKVQIQEKTVKDTKVDVDLNQNKHEETKTVEVTKPDGTKIKTTVTKEDTSTNKSVDKQSDTTIEKEKTVTAQTAKVTISALAGASLSQFTPVYGASITKPILGPITIGVWGLSNATGGLSIGLTF